MSLGYLWKRTAKMRPGSSAQKPELRVLMPEAPEGFPAGKLYHPARAGDTDPFLCAHRGRSMNPTLCDRDFLEVTPYQDRPIRRGDVIAFAPPDGSDLIAHRVVAVRQGAVRQGAVRTCGDNNRAADAGWLASGQVLGQVTGAWRGARHRRVTGGMAGRVLAWAVRWRRRLDRRLSPLLHPVYSALARSGLLRRWSGLRAPRVVIFQVAGQPTARLLAGHRTIGHYNAASRRWQIRRPYKLFVDAAALPHPTHHAGLDRPNEIVDFG